MVDKKEPAVVKPRPTQPITGGCLCGEVRYSIDFTGPRAQWPPTRAVCQCTICRKNMSCLVPQAILPHRDQITLNLNNTPHYKIYKSSSLVHRAFCDVCGSTITCEDMTHPDQVEIWVGTIDEEWLIGKKVEGSERETPRGIETDREGGYPEELCRSDRNIWMENAVPGLTDKLPGEIFLQGSGAHRPDG